MAQAEHQPELPRCPQLPGHHPALPAQLAELNTALSHLELSRHSAWVRNQVVPALASMPRALPQLHHLVPVCHGQAQHWPLCLVKHCGDAQDVVTGILAYP